MRKGENCIYEFTPQNPAYKEYVVLEQSTPDAARRSIAPSDVDAEQHHVIILHHIILPFTAHFSAFFCSVERTAFEEGLIVDDFGADESSLEIAVNLSCGLRSFRAFDDCPGASFLFAGGEIADEPQQLVGRFDEWGYKGLVMTDWTATGDTKGKHELCHKCGNDLIEPGGKAVRKYLFKAYKNKQLDMNLVRVAAANVLNLIFESNVYEIRRKK